MLSDGAFAAFKRGAERFLTRLHGHHGLVLRDVSPRNLLVGCDGEVKFVDFEQVTPLGASYSARYGTPRYAAASETAAPEDDLQALAFVCIERCQDLPWHRLRTPQHILACKLHCLREPGKYFARADDDTRRWLGAGEVPWEPGAFVDYSHEFAEFEGLF